MSLSGKLWVFDLRTRRRHPSDRDSCKPGDDPEIVSLKPGERLTLIILADCENCEAGYAYPSYEHLAERTGYSVRAVQDFVKILKFAGLFRTERERARNGWDSLHYFLNVPDEYREKDKEWRRLQEGETYSLNN